jgi:hypothetical protein
MDVAHTISDAQAWQRRGKARAVSGTATAGAADVAERLARDLLCESLQLHVVQLRIGRKRRRRRAVVAAPRGAVAAAAALHAYAVDTGVPRLSLPRWLTVWNGSSRRSVRRLPKA